jgi:exopolyphosphatase / guanosine-5'-triphosphate,3'-diphosphate pyrophosphatase
VATFAAVDIGANSVRLKIARLAKSRLQVIHEDREVTRLGQSVFRSGLLAPEAMAQTVKVLQRFHRAAQRFGADTVRVVATSALRDARNSSALLEWVRSTTGWRIEVISGLEEGRLIHLGVMAGMRRLPSRLLLVDLGGGSCELTVSVDGQIKDMVSLPIGAVRLTQEFLLHDPPKNKEVERLRSYIAEELRRVERRIAGAKVQMVIATSGTPAALAEASGRMQRGGTATVPRQSVDRIARQLKSLNLQQRRAIEGIGPKRAEIIVAGAFVFSELMHACSIRQFRYSPLGLRDGLLAQFQAEYGASKQMQERIRSERWNALLNAVKHYGVNQRTGDRARNLVQTLFDQLKKVHALPDEYRELLGAAAMLHEVGAYVNRAGRHRHTYYIIANSEIFGYSTEERKLIAAIARYIGKSLPSQNEPIMKAMPPAQRTKIARAVALLRLALALDQARRGAVSGVDAKIEPSRVILKLHRKGGPPDLEMWALEKQRSYFRAVFGRDLEAALA